MFQVTTLFIFIVLRDQVILTEAVDTQLNKLSINYTQDINQTDSHLLCSESVYKFDQLYCNHSTPLLTIGNCITYNDKTKSLSIFKCPYFQINCYNATNYGSKNHYVIHLPLNVSQLNDHMCGPMNRKGLVCSECADGFGPSVTSFEYKCANCNEMRYAVPLFLFLEFAPLTIFYVICLVFQISVTSAPMPCYIMYAQIIVATFDSATSVTPSLKKVIPKEEWNRKLDLHIILLLYRVLNLEFGHYLLPTYCLSSRLKFIHVTYLGYISAFYPPLLIFLTWLCVELHDRNFRPLVWLWRPFHRYFVRLRRGWDTKSDIIDVFTTFFLLSYGKIMYQTLLVINRDEILNINQQGKHFTSYQCVADQSISYGSTYHLLFAIPSVIIFAICNFLPLLLLILYPIRIIRSCVSKCHLNSIALNIFTEKVYGCYRNGLDGERDMRCLSGLYFIVRFIPFLIKLATNLLSRYYTVKHWYFSGTLFLAIALMVALARPYRKPYMNYLDVLILSDLALIYYAFSCGADMLHCLRILLTIPVFSFTILMIVKITHYVCRPLLKCSCSKFTLKCKLIASWSATSAHKEEQQTIIGSPPAAQPLTEPTSTILSYGTCISS